MSLLPAGTIAALSIVVLGIQPIIRGMRERRQQALADRAYTQQLEAQVETMQRHIVALEEQLELSQLQSAQLSRQVESRPPTP